MRIGLLGCGVVGGACARILVDHAEELSARAGAPIELAKVAVRSSTKPREVSLPAELWTTDPFEVVTDPTIDVVVETIGGIEPALDLVLQAIDSKKHVVTANKELLSTLGHEVMDRASKAGVDVLFEASVAGGIPIIRPIREGLAGDRIKRITGIVNGTTNFILTRMSDTGASFPEALGEAETLGYTELDPTADIDGFDAASKIAILASLAFNARVVAGDVYREGISRVTPADVAAAHDLGYEIKLIAVAEIEGGAISARVHPAMLPRNHPLASVRDVYNAVFIQSAEVGELMFLGRGAGGAPTASAVVGDIVEIARNMASASRSAGAASYPERPRIIPQDEVKARYYVVLSVQDQPGALSAVAGVFGAHGVSIASVRQEGFGDEATLIVITHTATEAQHRATFSDLTGLEVVKKVGATMRVEGTSEQ